MKTITVILLLSVWGAAATDAPVSNWNGNYPPCLLHQELRSTQPLRLAVRVATRDEVLARQFRRALDFWSGVLDLTWREVSSEDCSMQVVDGTPALFDFSSSLSAKAQLPDRPAFQGWIAFNPAVQRSERQMFLDSVHEIGHVLGLAHNNRPSSVMFYLGLDKSASLDATDLDSLALRHQLRPEVLARQRANKDVRVVSRRESAAITVRN